LSRHTDAKVITSFPGLGKLADARVFAEICYGRTRFADARGLKNFLGQLHHPANQPTL
jgi:hypothetical protein